MMIAEDHIFTWFGKEIEKHPIIANFAVYNIKSHYIGGKYKREYVKSYILRFRWALREELV